MTVLLKLLYAAAITTFFVLLVAFGIRTFCGPPEQPEFPSFPPDAFRPVQSIPVAPGEPVVTPTPTQEQREYQEAQERYQDEYELYTDELADYRAIVFAAASLIGVLAIASGVALSSRLDALRLGLVGGGLGTLIYGVLQAEGDLDEIGAATVFVIVAAGLVLILGVGYRWLTAQDT